MMRLAELLKLRYLEILDLHYYYLKQFISLKLSVKRKEKAERSLRVTLSFLHIMMDQNPKPHDSIVNMYEMLHKNASKDLNSAQGLRWTIMVLDSFHMNDSCVPYHHGGTYELILVSAGKYCACEDFPLALFIKSLEHVYYYYLEFRHWTFIFFLINPISDYANHYILSVILSKISQVYVKNHTLES